MSRIDFLSCLKGTSRCDEDTLMDTKGQSQLFFYTGQYSATCFGLTCSYFRANRAQRLSKSLATISHHPCLGSQLHKNVIKKYIENNRKELC